MNILQPRDLKEALDMLAADAESMTPIAGGTDLMVSWPHKPHDGLCLLDLSSLKEELGSIVVTDDYVELGALVTYWEVIRDERLADLLPLLREAASQVGAIQIQTRGTWAGNIAHGSPGADGVTVLMAYDAEVVLASAAGDVVTPLDSYYTGYKLTVRRPDQLIRAIRIPLRSRGVQWFHKVGARTAQAISKVGVAMVREDSSDAPAAWRVTANSVMPYVCRGRNLEQELASGRIFSSPEEIRRVLDADVAPIDDIRSTAEYRATVLSRLIYMQLAG